MEHFLFCGPGQLRDALHARDAAQFTDHVASQVVAVCRFLILSSICFIITFQSPILLEQGLLDLTDTSDGATNTDLSTCSVIA